MLELNGRKVRQEYYCPDRPAFPSVHQFYTMERDKYYFFEVELANGIYFHDLDSDDQADYSWVVGGHTIVAPNENKAWDIFHCNVPMSNLDHYVVSMKLADGFPRVRDYPAPGPDSILIIE